MGTRVRLYSAMYLEREFSTVRMRGVLKSSLPARERLRKRLSSPLKFMADSLPPIIMRHEKARNTERRAKATKAADTWVEGIIASIPVVVDESIQL